MTPLAIVFLIHLISRSDAKRSLEDEKLKYRKNVVDFKLAWCQIRMRRYDWKNMIGHCLKQVPWDATPLDEKLQTRASISYVTHMDIKSAGFVSKIYIQSVSIENRNKTIGGDSWRVDIRGPSNMAATVHDKNNGLYEAVFLIEEPGLYRAEIVLDYSLCEGFKDPPLDWFIRGNNGRNCSFKTVLVLYNYSIRFSLSLLSGCRHGSFQPPGSLGSRNHDFLQEPLGGKKITFTVLASPGLIAKGKY